MGASRGRVGFFVGGDGKRREIGRIDDHWRVRQGGGNWFDYIEFGLDDGFVREFAAAGFEALEFLGGAAVETLGLGLIAEEELPVVAFTIDAAEARGQPKVVVLGGGDLDAAGEFGVDDCRRAGYVEGLVEAMGEEAAFDAVTTHDGMMGGSHALDGIELTGVDGLEGGDEAGLDVGDGIGVFDADDGEERGSEAVFAGVLGGSGFALGGARSGGFSGVGAIGIGAFGGDGCFGF